MIFAEKEHQNRLELADGVDRIRHRAEFLKPADRAFVELATSGRHTKSQLAFVLNVPASTVTRRLQRLSKRLYDPLAIALIEHGQCLRQEYRQIGLEYFLHGASPRELADLHQMSVGEVRRTIGFLKGWVKGLQSAQRGTYAGDIVE